MSKIYNENENKRKRKKRERFWTIEAKQRKRWFGKLINFDKDKSGFWVQPNLKMMKSNRTKKDADEDDEYHGDIDEGDADCCDEECIMMMMTNTKIGEEIMNKSEKRLNCVWRNDRIQNGDRWVKWHKRGELK